MDKEDAMSTNSCNVTTLQVSPIEARGNYKKRRRNRKRLSSRTSVFLWEFLLELLDDAEGHSWIEWTEKDRKTFRIKNVEEVAKIWGIMKGKPGLDKEALLRSLRYYYKTKVLQKVPDSSNTYQFVQLPYNHPKLPNEIHFPFR